MRDHHLKGRKQKPETIAKRKATYAAMRAAKAAQNEAFGGGKIWPEQEKSNGNGVDHHGTPVNSDRNNVRDALVYLNNALTKWPQEKRKGIAKLYVELALATLEGRA